MKNLHHYHRILPWIIPAIFLTAWFFAGKLNWIPDYLVPLPRPRKKESNVFHSFFRDLRGRL